jgi:hypothetical protein
LANEDHNRNWSTRIKVPGIEGGADHDMGHGQVQIQGLTEEEEVVVVVMVVVVMVEAGQLMMKEECTGGLKRGGCMDGLLKREEFTGGPMREGCMDGQLKRGEFTGGLKREGCMEDRESVKGVEYMAENRGKSTRKKRVEWSTMLREAA